MAKEKYALGLDYGTNSVRALIVNIRNGQEIATHVYNYRHGNEGILTDSKDPNVARQHPLDYIEGVEKAIKPAIAKARKRKGFDPANIVGVGVDTTGSTPIPVDSEGRPLALSKEFSRNLNAMAWLWKDHSGHEEAAEITTLAEKRHPEYLAKCGGTYSSEWYFSKILHCLRVDRKVFDAAASWVELADFVPAYLTGDINPARIKRCVCAAGHKAMYNSEWGGLPARRFLSTLDRELGELRSKLYDEAHTADKKAGTLAPALAKKLGLSANTAIAVGAFDAHLGAVGAGIKPGTLVKIIGTSTCDMMVTPLKTVLPDIPGLCGIVKGSILPNCYGLEAGQSAVGDIFNWFVEQLVPPEYYGKNGAKASAHETLTKLSAKLKPGESGLLALDWNNGNRTVLVDPRLTGLLIGQTLHTTAAEIYRALIEATAFGAATIINRFEEYGVRVKEVVNCGGIAEKNSMLMQIYADVTGRPMKISRSSQTCALGAAMFGATAGGAFRSVRSAQKAMSGLKAKVYTPKLKNHKVYQEIYALYHDLHDSLGTAEFSKNMSHVMKRLLEIRDRARA